MSLKVNEISSDDILNFICPTTFMDINTFIQSPTVPTLQVGDNTTKAVNASFVASSLEGYVTTNLYQVISGIKQFTGNSSAITQPSGNNTTFLATTAFVSNALSNVVTLNTSQTITASKNFTANLTAVNQLANDNSQRVATTSYVNSFFSSVAGQFPTLAGIQTFTGTNTFNNNLIMDSAAHISLGLTSNTTSVPATFYLGSSVIASQINSGAMTSNIPFLISTLTLSSGGNYILTANVSALLESITLFTLQIGTTNGGSQLGFMSIDYPTNGCFNISGMQIGTIGRNIYLTCTATFSSGTNSITTNNFRFTSMRIG